MTELLNGHNEQLGLSIDIDDPRSFEVDGVPVIVIHHSDDNDYTAHRLDSGVLVGWGEDKHEAKTAAIMKVRFSI